MTGSIKKYWIPFFEGKLLGEISRQDIEAFIAYLETLPEKAQKEQAEIDRALREEAEREKAEIEAGLRKPKRKNAASHAVLSAFQNQPKEKMQSYRQGQFPLHGHSKKR